ncbi:nucleotide-binding universal stress UspA family protein [Paraburkholderia sp. BL23I1N1]|uniref:hemerythrin domain-containing protein n=1 Tax=Paraburkholderia sp. BL23I1N1 TaxID=1938802 RepID=UPI000E73E72C|nr:hemerythrin domain-containing protein [Paraburkholderia sp. BL23I1N1]RKE39617.1 nucleotide-binding universal stress UspA family protein [Paraburkholderia sp. BL23I1N1]
MYRHFLVPVGDIDSCIEATGHAIAFAQSMGARITFLPILYQQASTLQHEDSREPGMADAAQSACDARERALELLARAEAAARAQGVPYSSVAASGETPFDSIVAAAVKFECDLICIAPGQWLAEADDVVVAPSDGSDAGNVAVLIGAADRRPATSRAIGVLLDQHRTIADTVHALLDCVRIARAAGQQPEPIFMREALERLRDLQVRRHRLKEDVRFFQRLRECTSVADAELDELECQHQRDEQLLYALAELVERDAEPGVPIGRLEQALDVYAQFTWEHLGREEGVVLPAARRYLRDEDWNEIATAFDATAADWATPKK